MVTCPLNHMSMCYGNGYHAFQLPFNTYFSTGADAICRKIKITVSVNRLCITHCGWLITDNIDVVLSNHMFF